MLKFTARIASEVSGVPHNSINSLLNRGLWVAEGKAPGRGKARDYTIAEVAMLALMRDLTEALGMRPDTAGEICAMCSAPFKRLVLDIQQASGDAYLVIRFSEDRNALRYSTAYGPAGVAESMTDWCESNFPHVIVINIYKVFNRTLSLLKDRGVLLTDWQDQVRLDAGIGPK